MSEILSEFPAERTEELIAPKLTITSLTFSDGTKLDFEEDEIIVFVGPNNAGKSAALREIQHAAVKIEPRTVIKNATLGRSGNLAEFKRYLEMRSLKTGEFNNTRYGGIGYNIHHAHIGHFDRDDRGPVAGFFCARLETEARLSGSNPAGAIQLYREPPSHPIHLLMMDPKLAEKVSQLFRQAFGTDLTVFRAGGGIFPLYIGTKPTLSPGEDELSREFVEKMLLTGSPLSEQGDGMRSFATMLLHTLAVTNHSIQLLDEPEAFLHPPQARLIGEFIARERTSKSQLFIATHSTDVLDGLIAGRPEKLRLIRLQREGTANHVKELSRQRTTAIVKDTLARYSGVLGGIFYQHVIICEADADCLFYNSILTAKAVSGDRNPDVLFIHTAGKHRMAQLAETLRELDVPVSVIADIDLLKEKNTFANLVEKLGGKWAEIDSHFQAIKQSIETRRPPLNAEQVAGLVHAALKGAGGTAEFPKATESEIKRIFKSLSPWDDVKRAGRSALSKGQTVKHFDESTNARQSGSGLFLLENWRAGAEVSMADTDQGSLQRCWRSVQ
jgi:energy-coupling factor transporter ATP-binding protein EcfA2